MVTEYDAKRLAEIRNYTDMRTRYEGRVEPTDEFLLRLLDEERAARQWRPGMPRCSSCDNGTLADWTYCPHCGAQSRYVDPLPEAPQ